MENPRIELRTLQLSDYKELRQSMTQAYPNWPGGYWREETIEKLLKTFPEGQFGILVDGKIVGSALSIIVKLNKFGLDHTYAQITGNYTFSTHNAKGDVLYGIDVFIHPDFRGLRLARRLYDARKELCERLNLRAIVFGGRIPNYYKYSQELSPREYIAQVRLRKIFDPVLTFQLANDFHAKRVLKGYLPDDHESGEYAVLLQWDNIYYSETPIEEVSVVRLGLVQWQMRPYNSAEELYEQIEYFVDAVAGYNCDFVLFPEFFNAPLMAPYNDEPAHEAVRKLAGYTEEIQQKFTELAIAYNINIITGSMPQIEGEKLLNVGFLCRRDGSTERYVKIHVTPDEARVWGMQGGDILRAFDTDCGKIGVLICYDVEFPELPRLLADEGVNLLFVPFLTDTQNGYMRVRTTAAARAIENECYVAIAGSVGNLPKVHNMDIQFAQSVVFTPCDFAFPTNGIKAEATPNTEMILIADVDLMLLKELNLRGAVRNLNDRRRKLFDLKWTGPLLLLMAFLLGACGGSPTEPTLSRFSPQVEVHGHRGARGYLPENSIPGFILAVEQGADVVEMDLVITADSQVVVNHEPWLNPDICLDPFGVRIDTAKQWNIFEMKMSTLRHCDCGSLGNPRFPQQAAMPVQRSALWEVAQVIEHMYTNDSLPVRYNLELKYTAEGVQRFHPDADTFVKLVLDELTTLGIAERTTLQSFAPEVLEVIHRLAPDQPVVWLVEDDAPLTEHLDRLSFTPAVYSPYHITLTPEDILAAQKLGMKVIPWTVNTEGRMDTLLHWGVDGIITDYPDRLVNRISALKALNAEK